jgi:hypothetical protein
MTGAFTLFKKEILRFWKVLLRATRRGAPRERGSALRRVAAATDGVCEVMA